MHFNFEMMDFAIIKIIKKEEEIMYFNFVNLDFSERTHLLETHLEPKIQNFDYHF